MTDVLLLGQVDAVFGLLNFDTEDVGEGTFDSDSELALETGGECVDGRFGTRNCNIVNVNNYKSLFVFGDVDAGIKGRGREPEFSER